MNNNLTASLTLKPSKYSTFLKYLQLNELLPTLITPPQNLHKLIKLVGCEIAGGFFLENCRSLEGAGGGSSLSVKECYEGLKSFPESLLWYLTLVFTNKTEIYLPSEKSR